VVVIVITENNLNKSLMVLSSIMTCQFENPNFSVVTFVFNVHLLSYKFSGS